MDRCCAGRNVKHRAITSHDVGFVSSIVRVPKDSLREVRERSGTFGSTGEVPSTPRVDIGSVGVEFRFNATNRLQWK